MNLQYNFTLKEPGVISVTDIYIYLRFDYFEWNITQTDN